MSLSCELKPSQPLPIEVQSAFLDLGSPLLMDLSPERVISWSYRNPGRRGGVVEVLRISSWAACSASSEHGYLRSQLR